MNGLFGSLYRDWPATVPTPRLYAGASQRKCESRLPYPLRSPAKVGRREHEDAILKFSETGQPLARDFNLNT